MRASRMIFDVVGVIAATLLVAASFGGLWASSAPIPPSLNNPQNPVKYGGDPTGNLNSASAFQSAINAGDLDVPAGTQPNAQIRLKGAGLPPLHGGRRGDLVVVCNVLVPKKLDQAQADLIKQLAAASGEELPKGHEKSSLLGGLFGKKH